MLRAAVLLLVLTHRRAIASTCMDSAELVSYVRERVAGLEETTIEDVVATLRKSRIDSCITSDVLEERARCGEQGLSDAIRAIQMFALGLDAVPAPIRPSPGVPCVQIPSSPDIVVLEWSHQADSLQRVRSFGVRRERVGGGDGQAKVRNLTIAEFQKCRDKGRCTFHDQIEPGHNYIYTVTATNDLGTSSATEIFCATRANVGLTGLNARCSLGDELLADATDGEARAIDATPMSVSGTLAGCVVSAAVASALTVFLLDRAVVNGNAQLCDTISSRMSSSSVANQAGGSQPTARAAGRGWFESVQQEAYRWKAIIFLALVYGIGIWMWLPVELQLLPALRNMALTSQRYIARDMVDDPGDTSHESFAAVQESGQSVKLVADSYENFAVSAHEWERGLLALHREQRITIDNMVDGTTDVWQPVAMALFLCFIVLFAYILELLVWTKWLWEGTRLMEVLQYTSIISPGCKLGRFLFPLCCLGCWRTYAVIDTAISVANHMRRNVDLLLKLADFLPPSDDMARIRTELHAIVSRHNEGRQRRWGITLGQCAGGPCHIDKQFWEAGSSTAKLVGLSLLFFVPVVLLVARDKQNKKEKEEQEKLINQQRMAHEAVKRLAEEKERQYTRAKDEALTQQQRAEALEKAHRAEKKERDAIKEEQRLVLREIMQRDVTALWEDSKNAPPHLRKNDWRRCVINTGAAGQICRAWCEGSLRRKVAIKRPKEPNAANLQRSFSTVSGRSGLTDEQKFFLYLQHENIAKCYGTLEEKPGVHSIVMELCKCDLSQWLSEEAFWTEKTLQQIDEQKMDAIRQVSQGIHFLHEKLVVHLDLKAGNILLDMLDDGRAGRTWKLCDFGEAVRLHKGEGQVINTHDAHGRRNLTAEIASPELFSGTGVGMKADIFAFGCVMWSILTRLRAWHWIQGAYKGNVIEKAVGLDAKRPRCPESQLTDMIRLCMHHNPEMRPTAQDLSTWAHKRFPNPRRQSRSTRSRPVSNESVVRVLEVSSDTLLGERVDQLWTGTVPGLLNCECIPVPPVHGCEFQVECSENTEDLTIRTTQHQAEEVTQEAAHALFNDCDTDNSGGLDRAEVRRMFVRGGIEWSDQLEHELEREWGTLGIDGEVDFQSFFRWWSTVSPSDELSHLRRELHRAGMFSSKKASVRFPCTVAPGWIVTDSSRSTGLSWNITGQYIAKQGSTRREEWEEDALKGQHLPRSISQEKEEEVEAQGTQVTIRAVFGPSGASQKKYPKPGIGIKFGNEWPYVKSIQPGTPAQDVPGLRAGCKLLRIESVLSAEDGVAVMEGEAVLMDFNDAVRHITAERTVERPLVLTFAAATVADT